MTIEQFVTELDRVRSSPPRPVTVETQADQDRLENLTGRRYPIGYYHSDAGFAHTRRSRRPRGNRQRGRREIGPKGNGATNE